ncbi:speckle-type POZ protein-like [Fopius arisanus]|uniref:Speckle-type POZ protein-like n=1 Tax=Fopius arisanus TaxID=64838 RepID=A0A0C9RJY3_9HYME|nr:PREDICTED: speckle-type POZ protein-like [Fopius arisanus]
MSEYHKTSSFKMRTRNPMGMSPETNRTPKGIRKILGTDMKRLKEAWEWTIEDFSQLTEEPGESIQSSLFATGADNKDKWYLDLYPSGRDRECSEYFSLYLMLKTTRNTEVQLHLQLSIVKAGTKEKIGMKGAQRKFRSGMSVGWRHFIKRNHVLSNAGDLLTNDELRISCEFDYEIKSGENCSEITSRDSQVVKDLWLCFEQSKFTDCSITVETKIFHTHKMILAARSPILCQMIDESKEKKELVKVPVHLQLEGISAEILRRMLQFIYTGGVKNIEVMTDELMAAADKFSLIELKAMCEATLFERLTVKNAAETLIKAHKCHAKDLKAQVIGFINNHLVEIVESTGYKHLEENHTELLRDLLRGQVTEVKEKVTEMEGGSTSGQ